MASRIHEVLRILWLVPTIAPWLVSALKLAINPDATDPPAIPGNTIHVQVTPEQGDPAKVNIYLFDTIQKNGTELFDQLDIDNLVRPLFTIPPDIPPRKQYVIRATTASDVLVADSPPFEILATPTTTVSSVSMSSTGSSTSTPSSTSSDGNSGKSMDSHIGAIIGGVSGGLAIIAITLALLVWLRRRQKHTMEPISGDEQTWPKNRNSRLQPFTVLKPQSLSSTVSTKLSTMNNLPKTATAPTSSSGNTSATTTSPSPSVPTSSTVQPSTSSAPDSKSARSNLELQKRRINEQMASIQGGTSASSVPTDSGTNSTRHEDADVRQQLDDLRLQIRQLEARQAQATWRDDTPNEPPPTYNR
ncbi:hypothetical protein FPV67DRAFT_339726 [Lyophyllum atratum]|nr:hypothetical protein FPV67DRAFT_339726 [Lyophyllum atratum]